MVSKSFGCQCDKRPLHLESSLSTQSLESPYSVSSETLEGLVDLPCCACKGRLDGRPYPGLWSAGLDGKPS